MAHARMRFRVIAEEEADFNTWMDAMKTPPKMDNSGWIWFILSSLQYVSYYR